MKRYMLHPGWICSKNDGDWHFIGVGQLVQAYRINIKECLVCASCQGREALPCTNEGNLINLFPRYDGDYESHRSLLEGEER